MDDKSTKNQMVKRRIYTALKLAVTASLVTSLVGCSFFRNREEDYLRMPVTQTQGIEVPKSVTTDPQIHPELTIPKGQDSFDTTKNRPNTEPPNSQKNNSLELLKLLQAQSADSNLTVIKGKYALLSIDASMDKSFDLISKELESIPDINVISESKADHSFKVQSLSNNKIYYLYLATKAKQTRLSVFNKSHELVADEAVVSFMTQLSSRIQALRTGGDSNVKIQYPLKITKLEPTNATLTIGANEENAYLFVKQIIESENFSITYADQKNKMITFSDLNDNSYDFNLKILPSENKQDLIQSNALILVTDHQKVSPKVQPLKSTNKKENEIISSNTQKARQSFLAGKLKALALLINQKATETYISQSASLSSLSSSIYVDFKTKKAILVVPGIKDKILTDIKSAVKQMNYQISHEDKQNGFYFIAPLHSNDYQYLIYLKEESTKESHWYDLGFFGTEHYKTYIQIFDKNGGVMPLDQTKALLTEIQSYL